MRAHYTDEWPGGAAWAEALAWDSVEEQGQEVPVPVEMPCPVCAGDGCAACARAGFVMATDDDAAALAAFRRAAAAFLHPSGLAER